MKILAMWRTSLRYVTLWLQALRACLERWSCPAGPAPRPWSARGRL
jgi:hypothetical protein